MEKYLVAIEKMKQGDFLGSYDEFSNIININPKDYFALFYRALLGFLHLAEKLEQSIDDFERCIKEKSPFLNQAKAYLSILYSNNDEPNKAIVYGLDALKNDTELKLDVNFALSKAYYQIGDYYSLLKSLEYLNNCINEEADEIVDFYVCKVDILLTMNNLTQADETLNTIYYKFGGSYTYYYLLSRLQLLQYKNSQNKEFLEKSLRNIDLALHYEENSFTAVMLKIEILSVSKMTEDAFKLLETVKDEYEEDAYLVEMFKIYEEVDNIDEIYRLGYNYLEKEESWRIYYSIAFFKSKTAKTYEEIMELKTLYLKAFDLNPEIFIFNELYRINFILNKDDENLELTNNLCHLYPNDGRLVYLRGECLHRLHYSYEDILEAFNQAHDLGYLEDLRFLTLITPLLEKPKTVMKAIKEFSKIDYHELNPWMQRKMGLRYLYGEDGYKVDIEKASEILTSAYMSENEDSCMIATYARFLEITEQYNEAFIYYQKAYISECNEILPPCNCAHGYLAHAFIQGIGIETSLEDAKKLVLEGIELSKDCSSNIVIYLYAYFALQDTEGFDILTAKTYLEGIYPFCRYEITRPMMLKLIYEKLKLNTKEIEKTIKLCLKYGDKSNKKYYKENKNNKLIYPAINNY